MPLPFPLYSPIMPLSNIARNCFRHGSVQAIVARWVVRVVVIVIEMLV
jgi:hypothetical protein